MNSLLLCTDGSDYAQSACEYAHWFAKKLQKNIEAIYVSDLRQFELSIATDFSGWIGIEPQQHLLPQLQHIENQKITILRESLELYFKRENFTHNFQFHHMTGTVLEHLQSFEKQKTPPDFIILGKRGENANYATEHLGSTMERIVRSSKRPCLVTPKTFRNMHRLVLAYDGGKSCHKAIDYLTTSPLFKTLEIHLITVDEGHNPNAIHQLNEAKATLEKHGMDPICKVLEGLAETTLNDYVESQNIDLLLMGAYGHSRIRYLIIGSTTTDLIRRCQIPILLFR